VNKTTVACLLVDGLNVLEGCHGDAAPQAAPCDCDRWRAREFDGLGYTAWHAKATRWHALGRRQVRCEQCGLWQWRAVGQEG
jgi:hypothetical protein